MRLQPRLVIRHTIIAACCVIVATGCIIERRNLLGPGNGIVTPAQYCPGDTLTASYDFLGEETCPADARCDSFFPNVAISSTPTAFAPQSIHNFAGSVMFPAPDADRVSVLFDPDNDVVTIPTARFDGSNRIFVQRESPNRTSIATRFTGTSQELTHAGMCAGATPVNTPQELPGAPQFSSNLRLVELCNVNTVTVVVTLTGSATGATYTQTVAPGACLNPAAPGVPAGIDGSRVVDVRPETPDLGARCAATGPMVPPRTLRTVARMACR